MDAFMNALIKMSLRGVVIILVVLLVRLLLKKLRISHKYILGLWVMAFLYFIFPWKLSLSVGFWNNADISEEMRAISELRSVVDERYGEIDDTANIVNQTGIVGNVMVCVSAGIEKDTAGTVNAIPVESTGQDIAKINGMNENSSVKFEARKAIELIWFVGLSSLFGHMLYSYFALKRKLRLSILFEDDIRLAESIDIPMVFGLIRPQIYLPISMESEDLSYVIAHEKMHIKRHDGLIKMFVYVVCLIHWFNPFIWIAYFLFGSDMEKACDEEVIRTMSREKRKEYAYALLHVAAENGTRKKRVFVAPIGFAEGNVKSRIRNVIKYRYTIPGIGVAVVIVILALSVMFLTEAKDIGAEKSAKTEESGEESAEADSDELSITVGTDDASEIDKRGNNSEERQVNDYSDISDPNQSNDTSGVIYNAVKYYNDYFYYSDSDGFKRMNKDMSTIETLAEGNVRVGNCEDNYIYYMRYPANDEQNAGVFRMNLSDSAEERLMTWSEDMWMLQSIYAYQNIVYLEKYNICEAYEVNAGQINKIAEKDNVIYRNMDNCNISYEDINELAYGYSSIMLQYHKVVYVDRKNNKIIVYDADSGEKVNTIEQCWSDMLVSDRGIVYKDLDYNIWLREWESKDSRLLYDMTENDNKFVNYGTYDNQCIYGFYEGDNECTLVEIMWDGGCITGRVFENVSKSVELGLSANNGVISFRQDEHVVFEHN